MTARLDVERALGRFRLPTPRPELARRVLDAARARLSLVEQPSSLDRLWASRPLRWAWVASAALALLAGAGSERLAERSLARALGPRLSGVAEAPTPEALGLDASWAARLAWAARAEAQVRPDDLLQMAIGLDKEGTR